MIALYGISASAACAELEDSALLTLEEILPVVLPKLANCPPRLLVDPAEGTTSRLGTPSPRTRLSGLADC